MPCWRNLRRSVHYFHDLCVFEKRHRRLDNKDLKPAERLHPSPNRRNISRCLKQLKKAFFRVDIRRAKSSLARLPFFRNLKPRGSQSCAPSANCKGLRLPSPPSGPAQAPDQRASSSRWPRNSSEAFTAFGETGGAQALLRLDPMARNHSVFSPTCAAVLLGALM